VIDGSGSTSSGAGPLNSPGDCDGSGAVGPGDDVNGNLSVGDVLDCELSGARAFNNSIAGADVGVGVVPFQATASLADVDPAAPGSQAFSSPTADADGNGVRDLDQVLASLDSGGGTNFDAAIAALNSAFATRPADNRKIALFLSDGAGTLTTIAGSPLSMAVAAGILINTFSVGTGSTGCGPGAGLRTIADLTGGNCTEVTDPTQLVTIFSTLKPAGIDHVNVSVNGGAPALASLDALGRFSVDLSGPFRIGANPIEAVVFATDATTAAADVTVNAPAPAAPAPSAPPNTQPSPPANTPPNPNDEPINFTVERTPAPGVSVRTVAGRVPTHEGGGLAQTGLDLSLLLGAGLLLLLAGVAGRRATARVA
jgi:hypothetical protein